MIKALKNPTKTQKKAGKAKVHKTPHPTPRETRLALKEEIKEKAENRRLKQLANHM